MADNKSIYLSLLQDCIANEFSDDDSENSNCSESDYYSRTDQSNSHSSIYSTVKSIGVMETMKLQLEDNRQQVDRLLNLNGELQNDLNKSMQANLFLEECLTCPYIENEGEIKFPGKNDLDKRIDDMFKELANMKKDLEIVQNDKYLVSKLVKVLNLSLPSCSNRCQKNVKTKLNIDG